MHGGLQPNASYYVKQDTCTQLPRPQCLKGYNWMLPTMLQQDTCTVTHTTCTLQLNASYYNIQDTCSQLPRPQCTKGYNWTIHTMLQDTFTQLPRPQCMKGYIWMLPTTPTICTYTTTADRKLTHHGSNLMPLKSRASLQDVTEPSKTVKESSLQKGLCLNLRQDDLRRNKQVVICQEEVIFEGPTVMIIFFNTFTIFVLLLLVFALNL